MKIDFLKFVASRCCFEDFVGELHSVPRTMIIKDAIRE